MIALDYREDELEQAFDAAVLAQGRALKAEGRVQHWEVDGQGLNALIRARVAGSKPQPYALSVQPTRSRAGRAKFKNECSCALGSDCPHVAATLFAAMTVADEEDGAPIGPVGARLARLETQGHSRSDVLAVLAEAAERVGIVLLPAARAPETLELPPELERWLDQRDPASRARHGVATQCLLYQLESLAGEPMGVQVLHARLLKTGGYAAVKPYGNLEASLHHPASYLSEADVAIVRDLVRMPRQGASYTGRLAGTEGAHAITAMLDTGRAFVGDEAALDRATWLGRGPARGGIWQWQGRDDGSQQLRLIATPAAAHIIATAPPFYVDTDTGDCGELAAGVPAKIAAALASAPPVPAQHADEFATKLAEISPDGAVPPPPHMRNLRAKAPPPTPVLMLYGEEPRAGFARARGGRYAAAKLSFDYDGTRIRGNSAEAQISKRVGGVVRQFLRDRAEEQRRAQELRALVPFRPANSVFHAWEAPGIDPADLSLATDNPEAAWQQVQNEVVPKLQASGWTIETDLSFPFRFAAAEGWYGEIAEPPRPGSPHGNGHGNGQGHGRHRAEDDGDAGSGGGDWFGLELGVLVNGERVNLLPILLAALRSDTDHFKALARGEVGHFTARLPDGQRVVLERARIAPLVSALMDLLDGEKELDDRGRLRLDAADAGLLAEMQDANPELAGNWMGSAKRLALGQALADLDGIPPVAPPAGLLAELRPYQQAGLDWLQFLRGQALGGILADDMGLGKTVQALAHILFEKEAGRLTAPALVVAPTSLMGNWRREAKRFAPGLKVLTLHGPERRQHFDEMAGADVVLTTYALLRFDEDVLLAQRWHLVILDEAQNIKNAASTTARLARGLDAEHRLCLTGTPLENHLGELWSQFHFLMPGLLGGEREFKRLYRIPIEKMGDDERRGRLAHRIRPFLLRRTKTEVAPELPPKTEILRTVVLEGEQRDLYETVRLSLHEKVRQELANLGLSRSRMVVLEALLKLRQVCCDPRLLKLDGSAAGIAEATVRAAASAKLDLLMELIPAMVEEGRKILLFSQFTSMLALIEERLAETGIQWAKLTGDTTDRDAQVERFQTGEVPLFLLSLKAGGVGLNLTAADTVIHYDPWWNPAVENQATDRAHRIGQDKPVFVYKLLVEGSVEERIQALQQRKAALFAGVVGTAEGNLGGALDEADVAELMRPLN